LLERAECGKTRQPSEVSTATNERGWLWHQLLRHPDFTLESAVEQRIQEQIQDAERRFGEDTKSSANIWRGIAQDESSEPTVEARRSARWRDTNVRSQYEDACRQYLKRIYFAYLNTYMGTARTPAQIRDTGVWLYTKLLDEVFSEKWHYEGWDRQTEWLFFVRKMGNFIQGLPEWREYLDALRERDRRQGKLTSTDQNPAAPRALLLLDSYGNPQMVPELAAIWAEAENVLDKRLLGHWEASSSTVGTPAGSYRELIPIFQDASAKAIEGFVRYLALKMGVDELLFEIRDIIIPATVDATLPGLYIPDDVSDRPEPLKVPSDKSSFGLWEQHLAKTWQRYCQKFPSERDKTESWRLCYHYALRVLCHRREFECALTEHLNGQITQWKSIAWQIKAAQKVGEEQGSAADLGRGLADQGGLPGAQCNRQETTPAVPPPGNVGPAHVEPLAATDNNTMPAAQTQTTPVRAGTSDKGNLDVLRGTDGKLKKAVTQSPLATTPKAHKTPSERLTEYKVLKKIRTHELVAEGLGLERSVYFDLKAGRKVSEETYIKAARAIGCSPEDLKP
jgi:hypothetical protein